MSKRLGKGHAGCPFCPDKEQYIVERDGFWYVVCYCGIAGPAAETKEVAIEAWDARQHDTGLVDALEAIVENERFISKHLSSLITMSGKGEVDVPKDTKSCRVATKALAKHKGE